MDYFDSGQVVCPYAKTSVKHYFGDDQLGYLNGLIVAAVAARQVAIIRTDVAQRDFAAAENWCQCVLDRLRLLVSDHPARRPGTPFVEATNCVLYAIGMGPQYPERHPRYAPALCLVVVNEVSIREVPAEVRGPIWRAVLDRAGVIYDPDQVWLPMEPS